MAAGDDDKTRVVGTGAALGDVAAGDEATRVLSSPQSTRPGEASVAPTGGAVIKQRFVLEEVLGSGGMGAVYRALDLRKQEADDRDPYVAVKLLNEDFRRHPDAFISLQREARKSQTLAHPNIVNVHDFDRDGDRVFMTMEYLRGEPLDKLLRQHPQGLERTRALAILQDIAAALSYAHSHRIAHSDLKPGNVFVTERGVAKVLDFGIARAVSDIGSDDAAADAVALTRFDPASLGALTPAYASVEMLEGAEPVLSDDLYALGCIAYELLTGRHPFERKTALEARREGLVPRRIPGLSRRQWRALQGALAFERKVRIGSVDELIRAFDGRRRPLLLAAGVMLAVALGLAAVVLSQRGVPEADLGELRAGFEIEVERRMAQGEVDRLLADIGYGPGWLRAFAAVFEDYRALVAEDDAEMLDRREQLAQALLAEATRQREAGELSEAERLLDAAADWGADPHAERERLGEAVTAERERLAAAAREQERQAQQERERRAREQQAAAEREQRELSMQRVREAESAVRDSLACAAPPDLDAAAAALQTLQGLDATRERALRPELAGELARCVRQLGHSNPAAAQRLRDAALALFPGAPLAELVIDHCAPLAPGSGGRGARFTCADPLRDGGRGPQLAVVPGVDGGPAFAIGRLELAAEDLARFCAGSSLCQPSDFTGGDLPATGLSRSLAEAYLAWLSEQTGQAYQLPTSSQWAHAARADGELDPNRNCTVRAGGLRRGGSAVPVGSGRANAWGLVNAAGNVQELVLDRGRLAAAGGHHSDPLDRCTPEQLRSHDGSADELTGLRVMRPLLAQGDER